MIHHFPLSSVSQLKVNPHTQEVNDQRFDARYHSHNYHKRQHSENHHGHHRVGSNNIEENLLARNLVEEVLDNSLIATRKNANGSEHENIIDTLENLAVGDDGRKCIDKIMMIKETVYDEVLTCDHSYDKR